MHPIKSKSALYLALCCIFALIMPAFALGFEPMADATDEFKATLSIGFGGQASCSVAGKSSSVSHKLEIVMSLNQIGNPIPLKSWSENGTGKLSMSKQYYVSQGYDYQVEATITVRDSSGKFIESFSVYSAVVHY